MMIGSTDNHSGNFIQPDWLKKGQQGENGLVSSAVKPENLNQKAVEELTKKLITENATTVMSQDEYHRKYDALAQRYRAAEERAEQEQD